MTITQEMMYWRLGQLVAAVHAVDGVGITINIDSYPDTRFSTGTKDASIGAYDFKNKDQMPPDMLDELVFSRIRKMRQAKDEIAAGTFDTPERLDVAAQKMVASLNGAPAASAK